MLVIATFYQHHNRSTWFGAFAAPLSQHYGTLLLGMHVCALVHMHVQLCLACTTTEAQLFTKSSLSLFAFACCLLF